MNNGFDIWLVNVGEGLEATASLLFYQDLFKMFQSYV